MQGETIFTSGSLFVSVNPLAGWLGLQEMEPAGPPVSSRPKLPSHGLLRYDDPLAHAATKPVDVGAVAYRAAKNQGGSWAVGGELPRLTALVRTRC